MQPRPPLLADRREVSSSNETQWERTKLVVPREHGKTLVHPHWIELSGTLQRNLSWGIVSSPIQFLGRSLRELRASTRTELLAMAVRYTGQWAPECGEEIHGQRPIVMSGHQPQLVHPGAWSKNLLLAKFARESDAIGLNLVVDHDLMTGPDLIVPRGTKESPRLERIPFDSIPSMIPWEEARLTDKSTIERFPEQVVQAMRPWGIHPVLPELWNTVQELTTKTNDWVTPFTAARNRLERQLGRGLLELPVSWMCQSDGFRWFVADILNRLDAFQQVHNQLLSEFRQIYRIRSTSHPVPDLKVSGEWKESPFWIWREGESQRRPLMIRSDTTNLYGGDGQHPAIVTPRTSDVGGDDWLQVFDSITQRGWKIRPRALTTTLFCRLLMSDLFVHGIGGAHYDEITDRLFVRFYGIPAPEFATVSAGWLLPLGRHPVTPAEEQGWRHQLHDLSHNPERTLREFSPPLKKPSNPDLLKNIAQIREEIQQLRINPEREKLLSRRRYLHQELNRFRSDLKKHSNQEAEIVSQWKLTQDQLNANRILESREYSFALYPENLLREFVAHLDQT